MTAKEAYIFRTAINRTKVQIGAVQIEVDAALSSINSAIKEAAALRCAFGLEDRAYGRIEALLGLVTARLEECTSELISASREADSHQPME